MSNLKELLSKAAEIRERYNVVNKQDGHDKWNGIDYTAGFVGDVGDLMKLVMAKENKRHKDNVDADLKHELGDCLWSLMVIANHYDIDLEEAFKGTMQELEKRLAE